MLASACGSNEDPVASTIIVGATVYDGTGAAGVKHEVRFAGDRIIEVGDLTPVEGEAVINADGLILAPGFIDTHGHYYDHRGEYRLMPAVLSQGVTTTVTAMDGFSLADEDLDHVPVARLVQAFEDNPAAVNVAAYSAHNSIRQHVMGKDNRRPATVEELAAMAVLVKADMQAGALGLSSGLEYEPGIFSSTEEVIELARIAADFGGSYASHVRDEDDLMIEAIKELVLIGREAGLPVHVSHIKLADRALWGTTKTVLNLLDASRDEGIDVTADIYPYEHWASNLGILFPDRDFTNREAAEFTFLHTASPDDILLTYFAPDPALEGLTIAQVAKNSGKDAVSMLLELAQAADQYFRKHERWGAMIIARGMNEADVSKFMRWPYTNICTDGGYYIDHPRSYGSFPRVFRRFVGELETLSVAEAIYKMTGLSARALGLTDRGYLTPGMHADLVLFDPESITDRATMANPHAPSAGIDKVWVNGELAFENGEPTERFAGRIVTHGNRQSAKPSG